MAALPSTEYADVRLGSKTVLAAPKRHFWSTPINGHRQIGPVGPVRAKTGSQHTII